MRKAINSTPSGKLDIASIRLNRSGLHKIERLTPEIVPIRLNRRGRHKIERLAPEIDKSKMGIAVSEYRMQQIREFGAAASQWFELIKEIKPFEGQAPESITGPMKQWLGALSDSPQVLYHKRGSPFEAYMNLVLWGPSVMRAMKRTPEENQAFFAEAGPRKEASAEQVALVKSIAFAISVEWFVYRFNDLEDAISRQRYFKNNPDAPEPKAAELIYFMTGIMHKTAMYMDGAEQRAFLKWVKTGEKMLEDIYIYGEERARETAWAGRMKKAAN